MINTSLKLTHKNKITININFKLVSVYIQFFQKFKIIKNYTFYHLHLQNEEQYFKKLIKNDFYHMLKISLKHKNITFCF